MAKLPSGKDLANRLRVEPGKHLRLAGRAPSETFGYTRETAEAVLNRGLGRMDELQERLYASKAAAILIVLQGMDTSGKDGTIKHVMRAFNAQGVEVTGFGVPSLEERAHDYLWRHHKAAPRRGMIGIHNRSHYESVLIERVARLTPVAVWKKRYDQINAWEGELSAEGTHVVKFFLHIGKDEQKERFQDRLDDPAKQWKFNVDDLKVRDQWADYMRAYEDALSRCSTVEAPWYVIPADRKWFRNLAVAEVLIDLLERINPQFPDRRKELAGVVIP